MTDQPTSSPARIDAKSSCLLALALIIAVALACQPAAPPAPTIAPLTPPPPSTPAPASPQPVETRPVEPTPAAQPSATSTPSAAADPVPAATPPAIPADVVAGAAEQTVDLTNRMLQPRSVDADFLWGMFITNRSFAGGWGVQLDPAYTTQMLEMWHPDDACFSALAAQVAQLDGNTNLPPLEFLLYMDHLISHLSPCVEDQLALIGGDDFFDNSVEIRSQRITAWFDRTWQDADDGAFSFDSACREEFYSHLPVAIDATDGPHLESAWASAMVVVSQCARDAMQAYFAFIDISSARLFELQPAERYTAVSLQMTMVGHLLSINLRKPADQCWPEYNSLIPAVAAAERQGELESTRNVALGTLNRCLQASPAYNPFAGR